MPSFDAVSEFDAHELANAVDQANREVTQRFDFKGVDAEFRLDDKLIHMRADAEFQLQQMLPILHQKMAKRGVDLGILKPGKVEPSGKGVKQALSLQEGIDSDTAKSIVKLIKERKMKVQAAIQGDQVRVTGKKRDDLQAVMQMLKAEDLKLPLQFKNFRD